MKKNKTDQMVDEQIKLREQEISELNARIDAHNNTINQHNEAIVKLMQSHLKAQGALEQLKEMEK